MKDMGPFKETSRETKYQNKWIRVDEAKVIRPDGSDGLFGLVYIQPGVMVVAIDGDNNVFLVSEYKYAVEQEMLEIIAGGVDPDERPEDAANRELQEETGYRAKKLTQLGIFHPLTTLVSNPDHVFLAEDLEYAPLGHSGGDVISVQKVPFDEVLRMVDANAIQDGPSIAALLRVERVLNARK